MSVTATDTPIHEDVSCDECSVTPIAGRRYTCVVCKNYDLCEACMEAGKHPVDHPLLLQKQPHAHCAFMAYTAQQTTFISAHLDYITVLQEQGEDALMDHALQDLFIYFTQEGLMHLRTQPALREAVIERCHATLRSKKASLRLRTWAIGLLNMLYVDTREIVDGEQEKSQGGEKADDGDK